MSVATIKLSETTKFIVDNRGKTVPTSDTGIPLIATNCIDNRNLYPVYEKLRYVSQDTYNNWFRSHPKPMDIILTLKGSQNGAVNLVPDPVDFCIAQDMVALRVDETKIDNLYLFAALRSEDIQDQIKTLDVSGVIPHFKKSDFDKLEIPLPPRSLQEFIGKTYFDLCNKIDLLHRQNKTLEAMAETLFRQWFIEEAKEDWDELSVGDIAIHVKDNVNPSKEPLKTFHHFSLPAFDSGQKPTIEVGSDILSNKYRVAENSILVSKLNPRVPRIWLLNNVEDNYVCSTEFQNLKPKVTSHLMFLYSLFKSRDVIDELTMSASGTSGSHQRVKPEDMLNITFRTPSLDYLERYSSLIAPSMQKATFNKQQIQTLENLRDTLLPKLMSGEVRVQYQTEEVA